MINQNESQNVQLADIHVPLGNRTLHYEGEDIYAKVVENVSKQVKIESAPLMVEGVDGKLYNTGRFKVGLRNGTFIAPVNRKFAFVANEEAHDLVLKAGFKPTAINFTKDGNGMFVQVFTDKTGKGAHSWSNDPAGGDKVEVGLLIRNSIDGTMAFGGDIFTYRSRCSNGAIIGKKSLGSFSVKHVGQKDKLLVVFKMHLERAFKLSQQVKSYYQKSAEVKLNEEIAEALVKTQLPQKFLPSAITVEEGKVKVENKDETVWNVFNQATENVWHEKLQFTSKVTYTSRASSWLINTVAPLVV